VSVGAVSLKRTRATSNLADFAEHAGAVQSLTRELCAASLLGWNLSSPWLPYGCVQAMRTQGTHPDSGNDPEFQRLVKAPFEEAYNPGGAVHT
jgi:hypothetical protein